MKASIIITTYNRPFFLRRAIVSALSQTYKDVEIIVVDDNGENSSIGTETQRIVSDYPDILYFKNERNMGSCFARNRGVEISKGELLCFLDDDDEMLPEHIANLVAHYNLNYSENLAMMYSQCFVKNETGKILSMNTSVLKLNDNHMESHLMYGVNPTSCILFLKKAIISVGGWIQIPCGQEDYLVLRLFAAGFKGMSITDRTVNIYFHNSERISIGKNKIDGVAHLYKLKRSYLDRVSPKVAKNVQYLSFVELALANRGYNLFESIKSYTKMCIIYPFNRKNISTFFVLLFGINKYSNMKKTISGVLRVFRLF